MIYQFGDFTLDPIREALHGPDGPVALRGHALLVLKLLVERSPEVVSKDEILDQVWGHDALSESSIAQVIKDIRHALGDSAKTPTHVVTKYGRGYQFIAKLDLVDPEDSDPLNLGRKWKLISAAAVLGLLITLGWVFWPNEPPTELQVPVTQSSVAQSPSPDPEPKIYLRAVDGEDGESLSQPLVEYLDFVLGSAVGGGQIAVARDEQRKSGARYFNVAMTVDDANPDGRLRFSFSEEGIDDPGIQHAYTRADELINESLEKIFQSIEVDPGVALEVGLVSRSAYATETLLRGMAAQYAGDVKRAAELFEASLAEDPDFDFARYELAIAQRRNGEYAECLAQLALLEPRHNSDFWVMRINNAKGIALWRLARKQEAVAAYQLALGASKSDLLRAIVLTNISLLQRDLGRLVEAERAAEEASMLADRSGNSSIMASARNTLSSIYLRTGRLEQAIEPLEQARDLYYDIGDRASYASVLSRTANVRDRLGELDAAEQLLRLVISVREQLEDDLGRASALFRLSRLARIRGDFQQSWEHAELGMSLATAKGDTQMMRSGNDELAAMALAEGNFQDAQVFARENLRLSQLRNESDRVLEAEISLYRIELESNSQERSLIPQLDTVVQRAETLGEQLVLINARILRAEAAMGVSDWTAARADFESALALAQSQGERSLQLRVLLLLAELNLTSDPAQALGVLGKAEKLKPPAYPYLHIKAKALALQGQSQEALVLMHQAKDQYGDWWSSEHQDQFDALDSDQAL